jgi:serine phosphatase RsbU (regulator of sigma subunit)
VRQRVAQPLERLRDVMLQLADGDLSVALPYGERRDEIGAMSDTLRVFKANAIRRKRLQDETLQLHAKLHDAYGQLRRDLEAAAVIQASLLPRPGGTGAVAFDALFQPSHFIAGDTYNVVDLPSGRAGFFQLDVAGHGAPAALVSVASHHTLTQALLQRWRNESLAELAERLNRDWPEGLPYCTMILGEIDVATGRGILVQAGHPSPLLVGRDGAVVALGTGGLPFGMLPDADFEETPFEMRAGDRLLIYSDGLVEAENAHGECFSDGRLVDLVRDLVGQPTPALIGGIGKALRAWRGSAELDDDVSVLVLQHPSRGGTA